MKDLLIIFIVLLVLLLLISTFGGSIRQKETFYQANPVLNVPSLDPMIAMPSLPEYDIPVPTKKNDSGFTDLISIEPYTNHTKYAEY